MRRFSLFAFFLLLFLPAGAQDKEARGQVSESAQKLRNCWVGEYFVDFTLPAGTADGKAVSLSDYVGRGKYLLVDFWASWCGPCLREAPYLRKAYYRYKGESFDMLGIAVKDKREEVLRVVREKGYVWNQLFDTDAIACSTYGIKTIPQIMLFAPDGKIVASNLRGENILRELAEHLSNN